jgi:tetratricopeptide (TPR) repeat protein
MPDPSEYLARASALLGLNRPTEAEALARQGLVKDPQDSRLHAVLGRALAGQERFVEARDAAERGLSLNPDDLDALVVLSLAANRLDDRDASLAAITRAVELAPGWDGAHRQRAATLQSWDRHEEALASVDRAVSLNPTSAESHATRGGILIGLRRYAEARRALDRALALDPEQQDAHRLAGVLALRTGQAHSENRFREALRLDPQDRSARAAMNIAINARNPVYRALMRYGEWLRGQTPLVRGLATVAPFLLARVGYLAHTQPVTGLAYAIAGAFIVITWSVSPVLALTMLASKHDRLFVQKRERRSALAFAFFVLAGSICLVLSAAIRENVLIPVGFGYFLWALAAGRVDALDPKHERGIAVVAGVAIATGIGCAIVFATGPRNVATVLDAVVVLSGIIAVWYVVLGERSQRKRRPARSR